MDQQLGMPTVEKDFENVMPNYLEGIPEWQRSDTELFGTIPYEFKGQIERDFPNSKIDSKYFALEPNMNL